MQSQPVYIVTGGAGFVGSNLAASLLGRRPRPRVVVIDDFRSGSFANLVEACARAGVGPFDGEVIAKAAAEVDWAGLVAEPGTEAVFHLGAITDTTVADERAMIADNVGGFAAMMRACAERGVPLVYASSAATYGSPPQGRDRGAFPVGAAGEPNNVYGFSKWLMEVEHRRFASRWAARGRPEPRIVGLRYFNVFGPGESRKGKMASQVYQLTRQILSGQRPRLFTDGTQARDQVYVDDVVECTLAAAGLGAKADPVPGVYNTGSGVATSFNDMLAAIRRATGVSEAERPTDYFEMPPAIREFYQSWTCADITATERGLGWRPRWKPAEAIERYAAHLARGSAGA